MLNQPPFLPQHHATPTHNQRSTLQHNINARAPVSSSSRRSSASAGAHIGASVTQIIFLNTITKQNHHQQHTIHYPVPLRPDRPPPPLYSLFPSRRRFIICRSMAGAQRMGPGRTASANGGGVGATANNNIAKTEFTFS